MRFGHFFVDRPIFAAVVSILITLVGATAYFGLPVAQYPEIAPPTIQVTASYPGASAEVVSDTVATPLEQEINGVEGMLYMVSQATADGQLSLSVTFALGTDLDIAQVLVQNRVAIALPRLPDQARQIGVTVRKNSPDLLMVIHLSSPDGSRDQLYISNYANLQIRDVLARLDGVGDVRVFGARNYSMRIWLDPNKVAARGLTAGDVVERAARPERPGRLGRARPAADPGPGRLPAQRRDPGPAQGRQGIREHRGQDRAGRPGHAPARHRAGRARRPGLHRQRLSRQALGGAAPDLPAAGLERARDRRSPVRDHGRARQELPLGPALRRRLQPDRVHRRVGRGGDPHDLRGGDPGRPGRDPVPADLARRDHPDRRHPGLADRHLRGHGGVRLLDQQPVAVRPGAGDRHRGRRRDRRGRERRAQPRAGHGARRKRRTGRSTRSATRWSRSRSCWAPCSSRPPSSAASRASSSASSRSRSRPRPRSPAWSR